MEYATREGAKLRECLKSKGLGFDYYIEVAEHIVSTLKHDVIVQESRFEEDLRHLSELFAECGTPEHKEKWQKVKDLLSPWMT